MTSGSLLLSASSSDLYLRLFVFLLPRILNNSTMEQGLSGGLSAASPAWVVTNLGNTPLMKSVQIALEFRRDHVSKRTLFDTNSHASFGLLPPTIAIERSTPAEEANTREVNTSQPATPAVTAISSPATNHQRHCQHQ
jgi:hypothetical protein